MKHQEQPKPAKSSIQKKPASKKPAKATMGDQPPKAILPEEDEAKQPQKFSKGEIQAMLGPRFDQEPDYEEPFAGHLAIHCTAPNCPSWLWIHRLYARTACQASAEASGPSEIPGGSKDPCKPPSLAHQRFPEALAGFRLLWPAMHVAL